MFEIRTWTPGYYYGYNTLSLSIELNSRGLITQILLDEKIGLKPQAKKIYNYTNIFRHVSPWNIIKKETWNLTRRSIHNMNVKRASQSTLLFSSSQVGLNCTCQFNFKSSWIQYTKVGASPLTLTFPFLVLTKVFESFSTWRWWKPCL